MTYHARLNLIMLATIAGLILFLYLRPQSLNLQEYPLSAHSFEAVRAIHVVRQQQEFVMVRSNDHWYLTHPVKARADEQRVSEILQILAAKADQRFEMEDLGRFGLEESNIQLKIDDQDFVFGGFAPITHQQYVATGNYIYLISPRYILTLPLEATELIHPGLLGADEIPIKFESDHLTVELQNGEWVSTAFDADKSLNTAMIKQWVILWQTAQALGLSLNDDYSTGFMPVDSIRIDLQDGQTSEFQVLQQNNELIFLSANGKIGYHFPADMGQQLLDPFVITINQTP